MKPTSGSISSQVRLHWLFMDLHFCSFIRPDATEISVEGKERYQKSNSFDRFLSLYIYYFFIWARDWIVISPFIQSCPIINIDITRTSVFPQILEAYHFSLEDSQWSGITGRSFGFFSQALLVFMVWIEVWVSGPFLSVSLRGRILNVPVNFIIRNLMTNSTCGQDLHVTFRHFTVHLHS